MSFRPLSIIFASLSAVYASAALAHEFWIEPQEYQVQSGATLVADLRNGQNFEGRELAYFPKRFTRFDLVQNGQTAPLQGRMGDVPAIQTPAPGDGLLVIVHQTAPKTLKYATWEKFAKFVAHKDFPDISARHDARGLPRIGINEIYTRYVKALVSVGNGSGADAPTGMETEFVALTNPYDDAMGDAMIIQLFYQDIPRADAQVEVFDRAPDDSVKITYTRTDAQGKAVIPVLPGHTYLLDAVVLRVPSDDLDAMWESLWAALTFKRP